MPFGTWKTNRRRGRATRRKGRKAPAQTKRINQVVKAVIHRQLENKFKDGALALTTTNYNGYVYDVLASPAAISKGRVHQTESELKSNL